jgi:hypothetical protein
MLATDKEKGFALVAFSLVPIVLSISSSVPLSLLLSYTIGSNPQISPAP